MISRGRITPLARIKRFSEPKVYFAYFDKKPRDDSPVLGAFYRLTGDINWNNEIYAIASKEYQQNSLELIKTYPLKYLKAVLNEFYIFLGSEPYRFFWSQDEWLEFRRDSAIHFAIDTGRLIGIPLLIFGMYAASMAGFILRISRDIKRNSTGEVIESRRCEIFILFNLIYTLLTANLLEFGEGCFMRMPIDPFLIIGAAVFITDNVPDFAEIYPRNTMSSRKPRETSIQKNIFKGWLSASGVFIFFVGLCVWNTYVVFHGATRPGEVFDEDLNKAEEDGNKMAEICKQAIRINPQNAEAYVKLGTVYGKCGRYNEAIKALNQAIRINPDYAGAYYYLGLGYDGVGRWRKAMEALEQETRLNAANAKAYRHLGVVYIELGYYSEAVDALKRAIQIKPGYSEAHYDLSKVYLMTGDTASALNEYKILRDLNGNMANKLFNLIQK
jgi:tetratricopeptide (TPR) repeat protein